MSDKCQCCDRNNAIVVICKECGDECCQACQVDGLCPWCEERS